MKFIDFIQSMYDEKQLQLNKRNSPWLVEKIHLNLEFGIGKSLKICGELLITNKDGHNGVN